MHQWAAAERDAGHDARPAVAATSAAPSAASPSRLAGADARPIARRPSCSSTTGPSTSARTTIPDFEKKYGIKVTYDFFDEHREAYAKLGDDGGGYDVSFPISVDIPAFIGARAPLLELDKALLPNIENLGAEWANPGYDPGNAHSVPYMWWTTGVGYDTTKITDTLTSSKALWDPRVREATSRCSTTSRRCSRVGAHPARLLGQHDDTAELDEALALLEQQKPLVRTYTTRHRRPR